jgi:catalase
MSPGQQQVLFENTACALDDAPEEVKVRHIGYCLKADKLMARVSPMP